MTAPKIDWRKVERDFLSGDPLERIADRNRVTVAAIKLRATAKDWRRAHLADGAERLSQAVYREMADALDASLAALKVAPTDEGLTAAKDRSGLIRAHAKALAALLETTKSHGSVADATTQISALDLAAARDDILGRLARLAPPGD